MSPIYIVAMNDGEYANTAYLCEITSPLKLTASKFSRAFKTLEQAQEYAENWAKDEGVSVSSRYGSGGITIFQVEMEDES